MNSENPRVLRKNSMFANKSYTSKQSRKPFAFGSGRFWRPSKPIVFREWVKKISISKIDGYQK